MILCIIFIKNNLTTSKKQFYWQSILPSAVHSTAGFTTNLVIERSTSNTHSNMRMMIGALGRIDCPTHLNKGPEFCWVCSCLTAKAMTQSSADCSGVLRPTGCDVVSRIALANKAAQILQMISTRQAWPTRKLPTFWFSSIILFACLLIRVQWMFIGVQWRADASGQWSLLAA